MLRSTMVAFITIGLLVGCGGGAKYVTMKDLDSKLQAHLKGKKALHAFNAAPKKDQKPLREKYAVSYKSVCPAAPAKCSAVTMKYENVFKKAAVMQATLAQIRFILDSITGGTVKQQDVVPIIQFGMQVVPQLIKDTKTLINDAKGLVSSAKNDFASDPLAIPGILGGLASVPVQLGKIAAEAGSLLASLGKLATGGK